MKSLEKFVDTKTRRRSSLPRRMLNFACESLANHTIAGPGSLAPAQATVTRRRVVRVRPDARDHRETTKRSHSIYTKFSIPLRQVFWL